MCMSVNECSSLLKSLSREKRKEGKKEEGRKEEGRGKDAAVVVPSSSSSSLHLTFIELLVWAWGKAAGSNSLGFAVLKNLYARRRRRCYMANGRGCVIAKKSLKNEKKKDGGVKNKCATWTGVGLLCCRDG